MTPHTIGIITGGIREPFEFMPIVAQMVEYRSAGLLDEILFTSWQSEFEKNQELLMKLGDLGLSVMLVKDMDEGGPSNMWRQYRLLEHALRVCPVDSFVLKARTDKTVQILEKFRPALEQIKRGVFPQTTPGPTQVFKYKLATAYVGLNFPFFVKDIVFLGYRDDLRELTHFEAWFDLFAALPGIEWQWKAAPFFRKFPIFRAFSEIYPLSAFAKAFWEKPNEVPEILVQILALYYHCLAANFTMHGSPQDHSLEFTLEEILGGKASIICGYPPGPQCTWAMSASTQCITNIIEGRIKQSPLLTRLHAALQNPKTFTKDFITIEEHNQLHQFFWDLGETKLKDPPLFVPNFTSPQSSYWEVLDYLQFETLTGITLTSEEKRTIERYSREARNFSHLVPELIELAHANGDTTREEHWKSFGMQDQVMRMKGY